MKKLLTVILASVLCLSFAVCTPAEEVKTLKVGALCNESGWFASFDLNNVVELKVYADLINERGGVEIGGETYMIEIVDGDGQSDNDAIRAAAIQLVDAGVDFVLETNDFWVSGANDIFENAGILYSCAYVDFDPYFWPDAEYAISTTNGAAHDLKVLILQCKEQYPDAKRLLFVANDDGLQDIKYEYAKKLCEENGLELCEEKVIYSPDNPDMSSVAAQAIAQEPDAILGTGVIINVCNLYKEIQNGGLKDIVCLAGCGKSAETFVAILGEEYANNVIAPGFHFTEDNNTDEFNALYARIVEKEGLETALNWTGNFTNGLYQILYCMQQVGTTDSDAVIEYFMNAEHIPSLYGEGTLGGAETYGLDGNRMNVLPASIVTCKDGVPGFYGWYPITLD